MSRKVVSELTSEELALKLVSKKAVGCCCLAHVLADCLYSQLGHTKLIHILYFLQFAMYDGGAF